MYATLSSGGERWTKMSWKDVSEKGTRKQQCLPTITKHRLSIEIFFTYHISLVIIDIAFISLSELSLQPPKVLASNSFSGGECRKSIIKLL